MHLFLVQTLKIFHMQPLVSNLYPILRLLISGPVIFPIQSQVSLFSKLICPVA
jgi:hypothetical protein